MIVSNKMIEKYNQITSNTLAKAIDKSQNWQTTIADNKVFNVSGENPTAYSGVNAINLAITNENRGNTDNRFMTRKQAEKKGMSIKEGAKAVAISYFQTRNREINGKQVKIPMTRIGYVYNAKDIKGIGKTATFNAEQPGLTAEQLIKKSNIKTVTKGRISFYRLKDKTIVLAENLANDRLISNFAVLSSRAAVKDNYANDPKNIQDFKEQLSAALIMQKTNAKFATSANINSAMLEANLNTDFLKNPAIGMQAIRSSVKIANFVTEGRGLGMVNNKNFIPRSETKTKGKGAAAQALARRREKSKERGGLSH